MGALSGHVCLCQPSEYLRAWMTVTVPRTEISEKRGCTASGHWGMVEVKREYPQPAAESAKTSHVTNHPNGGRQA
jgi:hypothetical protein